MRGETDREQPGDRSEAETEEVSARRSFVVSPHIPTAEPAVLPCAVAGSMPTWLSASKPVKPEPKIRSGGIAKKGTSRFESMDAKYKGQCCDGTRKWGDGNPYKRSDGAMVYCCGACRQELPRPALTSEQMARIEANKAKALALRAAKQVTLALIAASTHAPPSHRVRPRHQSGSVPHALRLIGLTAALAQHSQQQRHG